MSDQRRSSGSSIEIREIRGLDRAEAFILSRMRPELVPGDQATAERVMNDLDRLVRSGGRAWIARRRQMVAGFASIMPAPGLPRLYELEGFIGPAYRRQGLGSKLLQAIVKQLAGSAVKQIFYAAPSSESPAAWFLLKNGFFVEHEEQLMVLDDLTALPEAVFDNGFSLTTFAQPQAIAHFRRLYEASFRGLAWYQPYEEDREVAQELADGGDLLFLADGGRPVGFLWLRWPDLASAEIEPVGLLPGYRGRGLGRLLMQAGLRRAASQGADRVVVSAWRANAAALALYAGLGFRAVNSNVYLAYDL